MAWRFYQQLKNVYHWLQSQWWRACYRWPDRGVEVYGITGTNGKTTTSIVLGSILRQAYGRKRVGLLSTEVFWIGEAEEPNETHMTSTDARIVWRYLRRMADAGVQHVVLEMTSHALDQNRLAGLRLDGGALLNITHEHLDYHGSMEAYARAKGRICSYLRKGAPLVAKKDDEWVQKAVAESRVTSHQPPATSHEPRGGVHVVWFSSEQAREVATPLSGDFNKENVLAASLLAREIGVNDEAISRGTAAVTTVPGRMEWLDGPRGSRVLIDFALTPDALEQLYEHLRATVAGKLIAVFGAAGRRDREKRPVITGLVARYADEIVLTQDEPYDEPEAQIYTELERGLDPALRFEVPLETSRPTAAAAAARQRGGSLTGWTRIEDRRAAIRYALEKAQSGDAVIITGMGNYTTRAVGDKKIPWNDKAVVLELMDELGRGAHHTA